MTAPQTPHATPSASESASRAPVQAVHATGVTRHADARCHAGGVSSNSYVDISTATALLGERLYTDAWLEADATDQAASLMWATDLLDSQVRWYGRPATDTQALAWPQTGQRDHLGRPLPSTVIPTAVQQATALYALSLVGTSTPRGGHKYHA